jgi:hypothetical protein
MLDSATMVLVVKWMLVACLWQEVQVRAII